MADHDRPSARYEPERSVFLTDGVVAIALTLLALDLKPELDRAHTSSHDLAHYLGAHADQYVSFVVAFWIIARYWLLHHRAMRTVHTLDDTTLWANVLFLAAITLVPATTYANGSYPSSLATTLFAGNLLIVSVALALMFELTHRRGLTDDPDTEATRVERRWQLIGAAAVPVVVIAMAWVVPRAELFFLLALVSDVPAKIALRRLRSRRASESLDTTSGGVR